MFIGSASTLWSQPHCKSPGGCDYQAGGKWGHTAALFGLVGSFGRVYFFIFFFCFQNPYKNIWGLIDADSAFLTSSPHFLFLESPCGFAVALAAPLGPLL